MLLCRSNSTFNLVTLSRLSCFSQAVRNCFAYLRVLQRVCRCRHSVESQFSPQEEYPSPIPLIPRHHHHLHDWRLYLSLRKSCKKSGKVALFSWQNLFSSSTSVLTSSSPSPLLLFVECVCNLLLSKIVNTLAATATSGHSHLTPKKKHRLLAFGFKLN